MDNDKKTEFRYGWCNTDRKEGKSIRRDYRDIDYMNDEPYASRVNKMLEQLGLPKPEPEEIFRGTRHDLLFLDSHGVVLRIGPMDVEDLMNPAIVQPLGWLEDRDLAQKPENQYIEDDLPFTVAILPGIELYSDFFNKPGRPELVGDVTDFFRATGQGTIDLNSYNLGIMRVLNDDGEEVAVPMLLDADNEYNWSDKKLKAKRDALMGPLKERRKNRGDIMDYTLHEIFKEAQHAKLWQQAFQTHQPLRNLFWNAFANAEGPDDMPDEDMLAEFWQKCADVTNKPTEAFTRHWTSEVLDSGKTLYTCKHLPIPNMVLYRPWTSTPEDKNVLPIQPSEKLKRALEKAGRKYDTKSAGYAAKRKNTIDLNMMERIQNSMR